MGKIYIGQKLIISLHVWAKKVSRKKKKNFVTVLLDTFKVEKGFIDR